MRKTCLSPLFTAVCCGMLMLPFLGSTRIRAQQETPVLKVTSRLVVLDVVVTDRQGHPVDDLTREDFRVFENKIPQSVRVFEPPSAHRLPSYPAAAAAAAETFDPATPAQFGQSPVTVLVLDELNTHFADTAFARRELGRYLAAQPGILAVPTALVTIFPDRFELLQPFTLNRARLQGALDRIPVQYPWQLELHGKADYGPIERLQASLNALDALAQAYARIPGRKNLLWVGGGFPSLDPASLVDKDRATVENAIRHIGDELLDAHVTLYAVDPSSQAARMTEITDFQQMAFAQLAGEMPLGANDTVDVGGGFDALSRLTGGRVVRGMNRVAEQLATAVNYSSHFYTLGYAPTGASEEMAAFRKIQVLCRRPGLAITTRSGYFAKSSSTESSNEGLAYDLSAAAESTVPLTGLRVTAERNSAARDLWVVHVPAADLSWTPQQDGSARASVAVMAVSLDRKNKMLAHTLRGMTLSARAGTNLQEVGKLADFELAARPDPKAVTIRWIVRDAASGRIGSLDLARKP